MFPWKITFRPIPCIQQFYKIENPQFNYVTSLHTDGLILFTIKFFHKGIQMNHSLFEQHIITVIFMSCYVPSPIIRINRETCCIYELLEPNQLGSSWVESKEEKSCVFCMTKNK